MATSETIEIDRLLAPIPGDNPGGESLLYSDVYDKIQEARRGSGRSQLETDLKPPDWRAVIRLGSDALAGRSKDLQIAVWLVDALTRMDGFAGLRDGLRVLRGLHERFWDTMHPVVEDGDLGFRANRLAWLNEAGEGRESLAAAVGTVPITDGASGAAFGWLQWKDSREVDNLARQSMEKYQQALAEGRITSEQFDQSVSAGSRRFYEGLFADLTAALEECTRLETVIGERYKRDAPSLLNVHSAIEDCGDVVERILLEKRRLEPDPADEMAGAEAGPAAAGRTGRSGPLPLEPVDRTDALRRLAAVATFFRRTEPHSPVAYLVQRAIRWAEMPLEEWLKDVVASDDVLSRIRETLGIKSGES
jgi:type VI secretion system protein ImpA